MVHIVSFGDWGDVSRLSRVQTAWTTLLDDVAATQRPDSTWHLAQALLHGTDGITTPNVPHAMQLLFELANVPETEVVTAEEETAALLASIEELDNHNDDNDLDEDLLDDAALDKYTHNNHHHSDLQQQQPPQREHFAPAMKQLAYCYLTTTTTTNQSSLHHHDENDTEQHSTMTTATTTTTTSTTHQPKTPAQIGLQWLQRAHTLGGDVAAAYEVALLYEYGRLVANGEHPSTAPSFTTTSTANPTATLIDIDVVAAAAWFRRAARAGHVDAMTELALCYELGCGVAQNDERAVDWYRRAAERGHITAKYAVGEAFEEARGVPQSDAEACLWYYKAAVEGDEDSRQALHRLRDIARIVVPGVSSLLLDE